MSGASFFLDTNIVLYLLSGDKTVAELLNEKTIYLSFISELELLGYQNITQEETKRVEEFLSEVSIIDMNAEIKKLMA